MEGVGNSPPPFLSKTYDMVDDPSTDTVVSWSKSNNSFVVWNVPDFSRDVLPKFFKHNNFSSFVRQLNTYGFRKVDPDRFEFANEGFLKGQKHLLKNITRRKGTHAPNLPQISQVQSTSVGSCVEVAKFGLDEDVEMLKRDKNVLMQELVRLRQQQQTTDNQLQTVGQRVHVMEQRQQQMMSFLAKAMQSPGFVAQLVNEPNDGNRRISGVNKKRRLQNPAEENLVGHSGLPSSPNGQVVKYEPLMNEAAKAVLHQILKINSSGRLEKKISNPKGFLIDKMHLPNNALHSDNASNWASGVTLSEVLPSSLQPHLAMESGFLCDSPSAAISDIQSPTSMVSPESTVTQIPEMDAVTSPDNGAPCLFPSPQVPQYNIDLPNMSLEASNIADIERNSDAMPIFADDLLPVVGDSSNPDVEILLDDMPKLPDINDVFWEQFLAATPLPGDTDEINSSILGICDKEQDLQFEQENEWDKIKNMNHLTEQMGLLASASKQLA